MSGKFELSADGLEKVFATNQIGEYSEDPQLSPIFHICCYATCRAICGSLRINAWHIQLGKRCTRSNSFWQFNKPQRKSEYRYSWTETFLLFSWIMIIFCCGYGCRHVPPYETSTWLVKNHRHGDWSGRPSCECCIGGPQVYLQGRDWLWQAEWPNQVMSWAKMRYSWVSIDLTLMNL